jgi:hypothetical protein
MPPDGLQPQKATRSTFEFIEKAGTPSMFPAFYRYISKPHVVILLRIKKHLLPGDICISESARVSELATRYLLIRIFTTYERRYFALLFPSH